MGTHFPCRGGAGAALADASESGTATGFRLKLKLCYPKVERQICFATLPELSVRPKRDGDHLLKVKCYLEGYPESQVLMFDPSRTSHWEDIAWVAQERLFSKDYAPTATFDVEAILRERVQTSAMPFGDTETSSAAAWLTKSVERL